MITRRALFRAITAGLLVIVGGVGLSRTHPITKETALVYLRRVYNNACRGTGAEFCPKRIWVGPELWAQLHRELTPMTRVETRRRVKADPGILFKGATVHLRPSLRDWDMAMG